jgi:hypothetical protein
MEKLIELFCEAFGELLRKYRFELLENQVNYKEVERIGRILNKIEDLLKAIGQ